MLCYVYIARNFACGRWLCPKPGVVVGYRLENCFVVVKVVQETVDFSQIEPHLQALGRFSVASEAEAKADNTEATKANTGPASTAPLHLAGSAGPEAAFDGLDLVLPAHQRLPTVARGPPQATRFSVVAFDPPDLRNLEYFTLSPIFLQSAGQNRATNTFVDVLDRANGSQATPGLTSAEAVLEKLNRCAKVQALLQSKTQKPPKKARVGLLLWTAVLAWFLSFAIGLLDVLHGRLGRLTKNSCWLRQADLRLRQLAFFPVQFMSFHRPGFLTEARQQQLQLVFPNERHNIHNSNYINMYNSIWLMVNDVCLGLAAGHYLLEHHVRLAAVLARFLNRLSVQLEQLIVWIGSGHPGGFKLNNDLGRFMEMMLVWTLQTWVDVLHTAHDLYTGSLAAQFALKCWFWLLCACGLSFVVAGAIDCAKLAAFHLYSFNLATTKIYHQQIEMLKSLMQLFRGRKYNVLRQRIDKMERGQYRVDELVLGTFFFMVLLYLLPTTFAFYMLFFVMRVMLLLVLKLGDKAILCFDLFPLLVVLLKLKNSRRLQGGVVFLYVGSKGNTDWYSMENKALSFDQIFRNFFTVFNHEGKFSDLAVTFFCGNELEVRNTRAMKLRYLMMPEDYTSVARVFAS